MLVAAVTLLLLGASTRACAGQVRGHGALGAPIRARRIGKPAVGADGDIVEQNQLLFVIDPKPFQAAVDRAKAQVTIPIGMYTRAADRGGYS